MKALIANMVPMSDGVRLATDVWLPDGPGPFPTILVRTPYHRAGGGPRHYVQQDYAVVVQDCRGKYDSEGVFTPLAVPIAKPPRPLVSSHSALVWGWSSPRQSMA